MSVLLTVTISRDDLSYLLGCALADIDGSKLFAYVEGIIKAIEEDKTASPIHITLPGPDCGRCEVNCTCPTKWYCATCGNDSDICKGCEDGTCYRGVICPTCGYSEVGKRCNCPKVTEVTKPLMDAI